ncbi:hypothetical protein FNF29_00635 [Cafeteria roenbergensis]|uniref:Derlin n=1 Tax=Cafeteria roenbergensis TaxID=33653 RepID=A0A5A8CVU0_CAFRO|nr:hypothetical protein FNF29_00635 [Cafeteria roenbergensis]|eukprot:KAA0157283.1 hypothetical protein FNF29_00635 [Cafeteria roenbergensis]
MQLDNPREFYYGLPLVTRVWVTVALIATIGSALGLVSLEYIRLDWESVIGRVHMWRLLTHAAFLGKIGIAFLFNVFWLIKHSQQLENSPYPPAGGNGKGTTADYAWMIILCIFMLAGVNGLIVLLGLGGIVPMWLFGWALGRGSLMGEALLSAMIWVWSRRFPEEPTGVWMIKTRGFYLPWLILGFNLLMGGDPTPGVVGYFVGAVFVLLVDTLPNAAPDQWGALAGKNVMHTPGFMYSLIDWAEARPAAPVARGGFAGVGRTLNG